MERRLVYLLTVWIGVKFRKQHVFDYGVYVWADLCGRWVVLVGKTPEHTGHAFCHLPCDVMLTVLFPAFFSSIFEPSAAGLCKLAVDVAANFGFVACSPTRPAVGAAAILLRLLFFAYVRQRLSNQYGVHPA
jgi:hypothetical protein